MQRPRAKHRVALGESYGRVGEELRESEGSRTPPEDPQSQLTVGTWGLMETEPLTIGHPGAAQRPLTYTSVTQGQIALHVGPLTVRVEAVSDCCLPLDLHPLT